MKLRYWLSSGLLISPVCMKGYGPGELKLLPMFGGLGPTDGVLMGGLERGPPITGL